MNQMGLTFIVVALIIMVISYIEGKGQDDEKGIPITKSLFATSPSFNISAFVIMIVLVVLYSVFW
jgi:SSS family solute:Na+ symporter